MTQFRWEDKTQHIVDWDVRTRIISELIKPAEKILEFGAGRQVLRKMIDPSCAYHALDLPDFDLNSETWIDLPTHDVAVFGGVLEYIDSIDNVMSRMSASSVILSYSVRQDETIENRKLNFWTTHLTYDDLFQTMLKNKYQLDSEITWWKKLQIIARFKKS